ncbi:MAG TPA: dihydrolipoamide acetyltransferase family protein, partial [Candidatus Deferrimicrobiaceae bacterium]|nr:dihydrolipoamide acetyltransferase family protein [Candidatus Deferrimicrobiaceae bacterium]
AQETGKVLRWMKAPGDTVRKGEPIVEIETDKVTVEIESPASGILSGVTAQEGDVVPVGQTIALIAESAVPGGAALTLPSPQRGEGEKARPSPAGTPSSLPPVGRGQGEGAADAAQIKASPLARRIAEEHGVDLARIKTASGKIEKADVLAFVESRKGATAGNGAGVRLVAASPKARRLAAERGVELTALRGSGPGGAVLVADVPAAAAPALTRPLTTRPLTLPSPQRGEGVGTVWRIMAERMTASWTTAPHFYLVREVNVARLQSWLGTARKQTGAHVTYTDLLVKLVAATLAQHPRVNVSWKDGALERHPEINIGLAVALEDGLVVPVIARADTLGLKEIAQRREDLVARAQAGKLRPADIQGGVFTISNLGMFGVDAFSAIVNPPQAAILAVGRIADRVVPVNGQPAVQPAMVLTLSCDHRALDGARGAQFLGALADVIEEPLALLT